MYYEGHLVLNVGAGVYVCWGSVGSEAPCNPVIKPAATEPNPPLLYSCYFSHPPSISSSCFSDSDHWFYLYVRLRFDNLAYFHLSFPTFVCTVSVHSNWQKKSKQVFGSLFFIFWQVCRLLLFKSNLFFPAPSPLRAFPLPGFLINLLCRPSSSAASLSSWSSVSLFPSAPHPPSISAMSLSFLHHSIMFSCYRAFFIYCRLTHSVKIYCFLSVWL